MIGNALEKIAEWISIVLLWSFTAVVSIEVVARYGFHASSILREELTRLFLCALCFISYGFIWKRNEHIMLDIIFLRFGRKLQQSLKLFFSITAFIVGAVWLWCGIAAIKTELIFQAASDAGIPTIVHYYIMVLGMALLLFHVVEGLIRLIRELKQRG